MPSDILSTTDANNDGDDDNPDDDGNADEETADAVAPRTGLVPQRRSRYTVMLSDENERVVGEWLEKEVD